MTLLSRLAAPGPPPRRHGLTHHGVPAPAVSKRELIVPGYHEHSGEIVCHPPRQPNEPGLESPEGDEPVQDRPERYSWTGLLRRTFLIDVPACPRDARRRVLSLVRVHMGHRRKRHGGAWFVRR